MMKYAILIYEDAAAFAKRAGAGDPGYLASWQAYSKAIREAGVRIEGQALQDAATGVAVRLRDGKRHVQDGPFADTKEQLGGVLIVDVPDLDSALAWAARCPAAGYGAVEVRPVNPV
jgi:hypothetical protein